MPAGEIGAAGVADFSGADEIIEAAHHLLLRRHGVKAVELEQVDIIRAQTFQRAIDGFGQMGAGGAHIIGPVAEAEGCLGGNDHLVAAALDGGTQNFLGQSLGIDIGAVEHGNAGVEADVDEAGCALGIG